MCSGVFLHVQSPIHTRLQAEKAVRTLLLENSKHENLKQVDVARVTAGLAVLAEEQGFHDEAHRLLQEVGGCTSKASDVLNGWKW
jgi:hypothetical protein